jgi:O-antigen/teichoic acid export membrane protein
MKQTFLSNIFIILGVNLLIKPLYIIGIDAGVQNSVGTETYGVFFALYGFCFLFQILLDPGIQNYNIKTVSGDRSIFPKAFPSLILTKSLLALGFFVIILLASILMGYPTLYYKYIYLIILLQVSVSFFLFLRGNISSLGYYRIDSFLSASDKFILIFVVGYLLYFSPVQHDFVIEWFLYAQIGTYFFLICLALYILRNHLSGLSFTIDWSYIRQSLKASLPFGFVFLLMSVYTRIDGVMLERMCHDNGKEAGIYAASYRLLDAANMIGFLFSTLLLPMFSNLQDRLEEIYKLSITAVKIMMPLASIIALASIFYAEEIVSLIYVNGDSYYASILQILMSCFFFTSIAYIYGCMILAKGRLRGLNIVFLICIVINIFLNYYLIPSYKAYGAAFATLFTQLFVVICQIYIAHKFYKIRVDLPTVSRVIVFIGLSIIVFYYGKSLFSQHWAVKLIISSIFSVILSFLVGLLRLNTANQLLSNRTNN